jgi:hypothetical protein
MGFSPPHHRHSSPFVSGCQISPSCFPMVLAFSQVCLSGFGWLLVTLLVFAGWWSAGLVAGGFEVWVVSLLGVGGRCCGAGSGDFRSCVEVFGWLAGVGFVF